MYDVLTQFIHDNPKVGTVVVAIALLFPFLGAAAAAAAAAVKFPET